ncbi:hypothetical protein HME9304_00270 [Flagellimonas maritima]|uniref:Prepilin type IV endopeptidase peptidase domain-containing protein n=1 Tax=Flagellimonas maritima TaxID=1383885 RepID=A0A2Z4LNG2_9FLAO|nr:hypothetical protein [Allomuricauda aurantiaca]AWX43283.1 hypothetical protein HME9304_00270 [Allomuricauda aurantiaca]
MACLAFITYQDFKERKVFWFLFPLVMVLLGMLHFLHVESFEILLYYALVNTLLVTGIITILYLYTRFINQKKFLNHSLGLGDILFFYAFAIGFPTITFLILFVGATIFSLFGFLSIKNSLKKKGVPLAGLMSVFMVFVMLYSIISKNPTLYGH